MIGDRHGVKQKIPKTAEGRVGDHPIHRLAPGKEVATGRDFAPMPGKVSWKGIVKRALTAGRIQHMPKKMRLQFTDDRAGQIPRGIDKIGIRSISFRDKPTPWQCKHRMQAKNPQAAGQGLGASCKAGLQRQHGLLTDAKPGGHIAL